MKYKQYSCLQYDELDCGPTCLEMVCRYHRVQQSRQQLRLLCYQGRHGVTLASLASAAEHIGFRTLSVKIGYEEARLKAKLPAIAYLPGGHFVVIFKMKKGKLLLGDPIGGLIWYSREQFESFWAISESGEPWGVFLLLSKDVKVHRTKHDVKSSRQMALYTLLRIGGRAFRPAIVPMLACGVITLATALLTPFISSALVDAGILSGSLSLVTALLIGQFALMIGRFVGEACEGWLMIHVGVGLDVRLSSDFVQKLTKQPLSFFETLSSGDLIQRLADHQSIQAFLTESSARTLFGLLSMLTFGLALAFFRPILLVIFCVGNCLFFVYTLSFVSRQRRASNRIFRLSATRQMFTMEMLRGISDLKLVGAEQQRSWQWENTQADVASAKAQAQTLSLIQAYGGRVIVEATNLALLWLTAKQVVESQMTLGSMLAVQYMIGQMSGPLGQVVELLGKSHDALLSAERASEIHLMADEDEIARKPLVVGDIVFNNVTYSHLGAAAGTGINHVNLAIPKGKTTAIVGPTGSGKTTLLKLLIKQYSPSGGQIYLSDVPYSDLPARQLREMMGVVMQDGYLFADTIVNNIVPKRTEIDWDRINVVAEIAMVSGFVSKMPRGFQTMLGASGLGVSKGQAQRLLLARALYSDPEYLFLDEATSALDTETECELIRGLARYSKGRTLVVIAHRLSTVRDADNIIVLEAGNVVEQGSHDSLIDKGGRYLSLVQDQIGGGRRDENQ